jgi:hypothetical protein
MRDVMSGGKRRPGRRRLQAWTLAAALLLAGGSASADPTKEACFDANESAQALRMSGRLREAQGKLELCASRDCPRPVRKDCIERLDEVQKAQPTVVFAVRSAAGADMKETRVQIDGAPLPAAPPGAATAVDPGLHDFTFEADGFVAHKEQLLVREAEKERCVFIVLQPAEGPPQRDIPTRQWLAIAAGGLGAVGVGVGGGLALAAKSRFDAAENESGGQQYNDSARAVSMGDAATVVMSVGAVLILGGLVLWLTAPSGTTAVRPGVSQTFLTGSFW